MGLLIPCPACGKHVSEQASTCPQCGQPIAAPGGISRMGRAVVVGIVVALLAVFPLAALVALCFRFPIPFSGYQSGPQAMVRSPLAVIFYGLFGGFVVLAAVGAASGMTAHRLANSDTKKQLWLTLALALAGDFLAVMVLAVLDKVIGTW